MKIRIIVGLILAAVFALALIFGGFVCFILFTAVAVLSVYEMGSVMRAKGFAPCMWGLYAYAALMYAAQALYGELGMLLLAALCVIFTVAERLWNQKRTMEDIICSLFIAIYPMSFYAILAYVVHTAGRTAMLLCFAGPLLSDTAAYFAGTAFGKHKLCPGISPKKTVEGSIAGLFGGAFGGLATWALAHIWTQAYLPALWIFLLLGFLGSALGQLGDLFASMIKRWAGVKDYGTIFPEHGGVMDRLDSVLFCAPLGILYVLLITF